MIPQISRRALLTTGQHRRDLLNGGTRRQSRMKKLAGRGNRGAQSFPHQPLTDQKTHKRTERDSGHFSAKTFCLPSLLLNKPCQILCRQPRPIWCRTTEMQTEETQQDGPITLAGAESGSDDSL